MLWRWKRRLWDGIDEGNRFETVLQSYDKKACFGDSGGFNGGIVTRLRRVFEKFAKTDEYGMICIRIDNSELKPNEAAEMIKESFRL